MTTQNVNQHRITFLNLVAGTYYCPYVTGASVASPNNAFTTTSKNAYVDMDGFDHLHILFTLTAGAADSVVLTVESDDGTTQTFAWNETLGAYESTTNTQNATYTAAAATISKHLQLNNCNAKRYHVRLSVNGNEDNSGSITFRRIKV